LEEDLRIEGAKTFGGILLGGLLLLGGMIIFAGNGFLSPALFLSGTIMLPLGILVLATALTGGFGETPWHILATRHKRPHQTK
jgi:hypothetical protein